MHGAEAGNVTKEYYDTPSIHRLPPTKLNIRRRFWRWVLGQDEPLFSLDQVREETRLAVDAVRGPRPLISIDAGAAFSIIDAVNGKIIRYSESGDDDGRLIGKTNRSMSDGPKYYVVPEGQKLLDAIAVVLAKVRLTER